MENPVAFFASVLMCFNSVCMFHATKKVYPFRDHYRQWSLKKIIVTVENNVLPVHGNFAFVDDKISL